ncbi:MAG: hypothetical protein HQL57_01785 [Magnetococcales bacterium]|nr:hypothetical protein [Magnetococcales bacterium]
MSGNRVTKKAALAGGALALLLFAASPGSAGEADRPEPFTEAEMERFIADYPKSVAWLSSQERFSRVGANPWVIAGMRHDPEFVKLLESQGWTADRFFYLLNQVNVGLRAEERAKQESQAREHWRRQEQEAARQAQARMAESRRQMQAMAAAQRRDIQSNPYIPGWQKQSMLAQLDQGLRENLPTLPSAEAIQQQQRTAWNNQIAAQKRMVQGNPYLSPADKKRWLDQLDVLQKGYNPAQPQSGATPPGSSKEWMKQQQEAQWAEQRRMIENNPAIPADRKKGMLAELEEAQKRMLAALESSSVRESAITDGELALVRNNAEKLRPLLLGDSE